VELIIILSLNIQQECIHSLIVDVESKLFIKCGKIIFISVKRKVKMPKIILLQQKISIKGCYWVIQNDWISMATMYENLCGNCVGEVELTFV
jgi:hypothetical protein